MTGRLLTLAAGVAAGLTLGTATYHATIATRYGRISGLNVACSGGVSERAGDVGTVASSRGARFLHALAHPRYRAPGVAALACASFHRARRRYLLPARWETQRMQR